MLQAVVCEVPKQFRWALPGEQVRLIHTPDGNTLFVMHDDVRWGAFIGQGRELLTRATFLYRSCEDGLLVRLNPRSVVYVIRDPTWFAADPVPGLIVYDYDWTAYPMDLWQVYGSRVFDVSHVYYACARR